MKRSKTTTVRGTYLNEVVNVARRVISESAGAMLVSEDEQGARRVLWAGYARATWDCGSVVALDAPVGLILAALPASGRVVWVFCDQKGEEAWLFGTAQMRLTGEVDHAEMALPLNLVTKVDHVGLEIRSHGISIEVDFPEQKAGASSRWPSSLHGRSGRAGSR